MPRPAATASRSTGARGAKPLPRPVQVPDVTPARAALVDADAVALAVPVRAALGEAGLRPGPGAAEVETAFGVVLADELALAKAKGEPGEVVEVPVSDEGRRAEVLLLVGTGEG